VILKLALSVGLRGNATKENKTTRTSTASKASVRRLGILTRCCDICSAFACNRADYKIINDIYSVLKIAFLVSIFLNVSS